MARSLKKSAKLSLRRVRINSPSIRFKPDSSSIERDQRIEFLGENGDDAGSGGEENKGASSESEETEDKEEEKTVKVILEEEEEKEQDDGKTFDNGGVEGRKEAVVAVETVKEEVAEGGNRVMVVVDKALASTGALEWAITHTLQPQDTLFLLYFAKPFRKGFASAFPLLFCLSFCFLSIR
ncbi:unnamed protein product [Microthlaspi erraticum]|uniref:Uncharacterized protein n=1 Tax=Microthlaspi erraticum TaxID=1685480 RepID=A0A6D2KR59_9BRAS|nr:unnamed protein product [Microthlaspi erraticum]